MVLDNEESTNPRVTLELYSIVGRQLLQLALNRVNTTTKQIGELNSFARDTANAVFARPKPGRKSEKGKKAWVVAEGQGEFVAIRRGPARGVRLFVKEIVDNREVIGKGGRGGGNDVILLHGMFGNTFSWRKVERDLGNIFGGRIVNVDWPPFGLSEVGVDVDLDKLYEDEGGVGMLREIVRLKRLKDVVVISHSLSGGMGLRVGSEDWVKGIVLVTPAVVLGDGGWVGRAVGGFLGIPGVAPRVMGERVRRMASDEAWEKRILKNAAAKVEADELKAMRKGYTKPIEAEGWEERLGQWVKRWHGWNLIDEMRKLKEDGSSFQAPVLIAAGDIDNVVPLEQLRRLDAEMPSSEIQLIEKCGHIPQEEKPQEFLNLIRQWANRRLGRESVRENHESATIEL